MSRDPWGSSRHSEVEYARSANAGSHDRHPPARCARALGTAFTFVLFNTAAKHGELKPNAESIALGADHQFLRYARNRLVCAIDRLAQAAPDGAGQFHTGDSEHRPLPADHRAGSLLHHARLRSIRFCSSPASPRPCVGSFVGAPIVVRAPVRFVQAVVGIALLIAAASLRDDESQHDAGRRNRPRIGGAGPLAIAIGVHFILGALMAFGIGMYAPSLITLSLLGLNPIAAFPIMMGSCAFLMSALRHRFLQTERIDRRVVIGIALGGIPARAGRRLPGEVAAARTVALGRRRRRALRRHPAAALRVQGQAQRSRGEPHEPSPFLPVDPRCRRRLCAAGAAALCPRRRRPRRPPAASRPSSSTARPRSSNRPRSPISRRACAGPCSSPAMRATTRRDAC